MAFDVLQWCQLHLPEGRTTRSGWFSARCPFHTDSSPSFAVHLTGGSFGCKAASCGRHGSLARLVHDVEGVSWAEAFATIGVPDPFSIDAELDQAPAPVSQVVDENRWPMGLVRVTADRFPAYLLARRYGPEDAGRFGLHFGVEGALRGYLVFPFLSRDGAYWTWKARRMADDGLGVRYTGPVHALANSLLYGCWLLRDAPGVDDLYVVEGQFDVLRVWQLGCMAVGLSTAAATPAQRNQLVRLAGDYGARVHVMLDRGETAAQRASLLATADRLVATLQLQGVDADRVDLPDGVKDPDGLADRNWLDSSKSSDQDPRV